MAGIGFAKLVPESHATALDRSLQAEP